MRTVDPQRLASAARELSDAVLDPGAWTRIIEQISDAAGRSGAVLLQSDVRTPDVPRTESVDTLMRAYFANGWHLRDLRAARCVPRLLNGSRVVIDQDIFKPDEMRSLPMYNELSVPHGSNGSRPSDFSPAPRYGDFLSSAGPRTNLSRAPMRAPWQYCRTD